jgi:hypothetical protein
LEEQLALGLDKPIPSARLARLKSTSASQSRIYSKHNILYIVNQMMPVTLTCFHIGRALIMEWLKKPSPRTDRSQRDLSGVYPDKPTLPREAISRLNT